MKKLYTFIAFVFIYLNTFSQSEMGINQIYAGYSLGYNIAAEVIKLAGESVDGKFGQFMLGYKTKIGKSRFSVGLHASFCSAYSTSTYDVSLFNFYSKFDYHWILNEKSDFYSGIGVGTSYFNIYDYTLNINAPIKGNAVGIHINLIGYRHNFSKNFSEFIELGFLNLGIVQIGLAYNL
ncbi:MAG: hypothetical protein M0R02_01280 [Bacteroidales bacterium]|nr:hypothetical protein [Bacteroidales bacterium]